MGRLPPRVRPTFQVHPHRPTHKVPTPGPSGTHTRPDRGRTPLRCLLPVSSGGQPSVSALICSCRDTSPIGLGPTLMTVSRSFPLKVCVRGGPGMSPRGTRVEGWSPVQLCAEVSGPGGLCPHVDWSVDGCVGAGLTARCRTVQEGPGWRERVAGVVPGGASLVPSAARRPLPVCSLLP